MKAVVMIQAESGGAELRDFPTPKVKPGHLLIRVETASICHTDLRIYDWVPSIQQKYQVPFILGHEFAGIVEEVPSNIESILPGDRVVAETHIACGNCHNCLNGLGHICQNLRLFSQTGYGCFCEWTLLPLSGAWKVSPKTDPEAATLMEPLGTAVRVIEEADVTGKDVMIIGCGSMGQFVVQVAKVKKPSRILAIGSTQEGRSRVKSMGASIVLSTNQNWRNYITNLTNGYGPDIVIETYGCIETMKLSTEIVREGGKVLFTISPLDPAPVDIRTILNKEITIYGAHGRKIFKTWETMQELMDNDQIAPRDVISKKYPLDEFEEALNFSRQKEIGKILLVP